MLDFAAKRLRDKGVVFHRKSWMSQNGFVSLSMWIMSAFKSENRAALFQEIYSLFALNQNDTYRYSVSTAGAGGMVQMIPWAYNLMRQRHPRCWLDAGLCYRDAHSCERAAGDVALHERHLERPRGE